MQNEYDLGLQTTHGVILQNQEHTVETVAAPKKEVKNFCPVKRGTCSKVCCFNYDGKCGIFTGSIKAGGLCPATNELCKTRCVMNNEGRCDLFQKEGGSR